MSAGNGYTVVHQTPAGTDVMLINITGSTAIVVKLYEFCLGSDATPADLAGEFTIKRTTGVGSGGTTLTETKNDPLTVAATAAAIGGTFGTDPVDVANSEGYMLPLNQRATFRWVATDGDEFRSVAAANEGVCLLSVGHGGTPNMNATMKWKE